MPGNIRLEDVFFRPGAFPLLRGVSLVVESDSIVMISGRNGCGKSSLLELCAGLRRPERGHIMWDGTDIARLSRRQLLLMRQRIGYMFQQDALIASYTIFDNIALPLRTIGKLSERAISLRVQEIMEEVALFGVDKSFPESLSAGQLRSAALARALVTDPDMLLLDEPFGGIARQAMEGIGSVLTETYHRKKKTIIMSSHEVVGFEGLLVNQYILDGGKLYSAARHAGYSANTGMSHEPVE